MTPAYRSTMARRRVVVNTVTGKSFGGILLRQSGPLLVLADASLLSSDGNGVRLDGEIIIERSKVEFVQVVGG